jgi:hypothetical protein
MIWINQLRLWSAKPLRSDQARTLAERGLDFADAAEVFAGITAKVKILVKTMVRHALSALVYCAAA